MSAPDEKNDFLQRLQCQFLCCYPLNSIDCWEQQKQLHDFTCGHPLNLQLPVKFNYQLSFLKRLLEILEKHSDEVHDAFYETYCELQRKSTQEQDEKYAYKHYLLPSYNANFSLRESKSFVVEGTTGLCSWQASLALTDFLLHNPELVKNKVILELGAGTGLCGLILNHCCGPKHVCLTDGSRECIELMRENVQRNFKDAVEVKHCNFMIKNKFLSCLDVEWNTIINANLDHIKPNLILAADVVYDDSVLTDLSNAIDFIFNMMENRTKMFLAATVRNEETLAKFFKILNDLKFSAIENNVIPLAKSNLYWDRSTPVKIFLITKC